MRNKTEVVTKQNDPLKNRYITDVYTQQTYSTITV